MQAYFSYAMYIIAIILLVLSFTKNRMKTFFALKKALRMFLSILPQFISILLLMGVIIAIVKPESIKTIIGNESGIMGVIVSALLGAIALMPALVAFPVAAELLNMGAGLIQIAVFISTLTTVGVITIPLEKKYFGKKIAIYRNVLFFIASFFVATVMKLVMI